MDVDDVVKRVHVVQEAIELTAVRLVDTQVSPSQVVDVKEQVALTRKASKPCSMKYKSLMLTYTRK